eukprot:30136-Pelagococcus_subviridis.AAC.2
MYKQSGSLVVPLVDRSPLGLIHLGLGRQDERLDQHREPHHVLERAETEEHVTQALAERERVRLGGILQGHSIQANVGVEFIGVSWS